MLKYKWKIKKEINNNKDRNWIGNLRVAPMLSVKARLSAKVLVWKIFHISGSQLVCDPPDSLQDETDYLNNYFRKNNYNTDFVRRNTHSNTDSNTQTNVNSGLVTKATIPYIRGTSSETIARILQPYNIHVAHKPITTLRRVLTNVKDKDKPEDRQGAVYKIKCCDCQASYIGETGRNLSTRLTEHKRATRNGDVKNHIAEHHLQTKHQIDWDCDMCYVFYRLLSTTYFRKLVY